jgi:hypothetical protein
MFKIFFSEIVPFMRKCKKKIVQPYRPQMTLWRVRIAFWITKATNIHSEYICHDYCISTVTMVARTRLSVTLHVHCRSCYSNRKVFSKSPNFTSVKARVVRYSMKYGVPTCSAKERNNIFNVFNRLRLKRCSCFYFTENSLCVNYRD